MYTYVHERKSKINVLTCVLHCMTYCTMIIYGPLSLSSPTLAKLRLSTKVQKVPRLLRRSRNKMSKKPPVPEKSEHIRSLPVARPRKAPPPKPLPYNVHKEVVKKPDPAPRKVGQQQQRNGSPKSDREIATNKALSGGGRGCVEGSPPLPPPRPRGQISKSSTTPSTQSGGTRPATSRPRLDTPVTPPDPDLPSSQNGVVTPPVPVARSGAVAASTSRGRVPLPEVNGKKTPPSPRRKPLVRRDKDDNGCLGAGLYSEAYSTTAHQPTNETDADLYSTVVDSPRRVKTPSGTPPTPLSGSLTPPTPLPRPPAATSAPAGSPASLPTHVSRKLPEPPKPRSPLVAAPEPTPPNTYSVLARPDQPNKALNPSPPRKEEEDDDATAHTYSSLDQEGVQQPAPPVKPANQVYMYMIQHTCITSKTG